MEYKLVQVQYRDSHEGLVDDVTLDELIQSRKAIRFYRPSQERWIDVETEPVRSGEPNPEGYVRRTSDNGHRHDLFLKALSSLLDKQEAEQLAKKPRGPLWKVFRRNRKTAAPQETLTAEEWFEKGFTAFHRDDDDQGALRAFAKSIHLNPSNPRAYFNRAIMYEKVGNLYQAIDDYRKAIELAPEDAKLYYMRGLACKRLGQEDEALHDLERAACLNYRPALDFFKARGIAI